MRELVRIQGVNPAFKSRLLSAAQTFGTPLYAYDWQTIERQLERLRTAFGEARVFYAMKANPSLGILRRLNALNVGFEAVSGGELERAVLAGATGAQVVLNGPGKLNADYARAKQVGATLILDNKDEARRASSHAFGSQALIRVNPGLRVSTHDHLATGNATSKFGVALEDVPQAVLNAEKSGLEVIGLQMHIGSSITDPNDYRDALERMAGLAAQIGSRRVFDMGGGFGLDFELEPLAALGWEAARAFGATELWVEPGRWLVAESGVLLTTVLERKSTARDFAVVDAGMSELIRPMLYDARHPVESLMPPRDAVTLDIAGPACESGDILARDVTLPDPNPGDVLMVGVAGAYGSSMSSHYLTRSRPAEVLLDGERWEMLRRRETIQELLRTETDL
ncbi:MAG: diaminopimelate decarboxylase [Pleurocapsa sp. SU_196_0]|nr:diaminopimelate decarboxylase [Pleurocapsa sp. SU_196_0]